MHIKKKDTKGRINSESCAIRDYEFGSKLLSFVTATISGRYPNSGEPYNEECEMVYYVISGSGRMSVEDEIYQISEGSLVHIPVGAKYWVEGELEVAIANTPPWNPNQYKISSD